MQLSLSTFVPVSPEPASPGAAADAVTGQAAVDSTAVSFEELLPVSLPPARPAAEEQGPESEMAASILAASFWMPGMQLPPKALPEPVTADPVSGETSAESPAEPPAARRSVFTFFSQGGPSVFSAAPSVRTFAPLNPGPAAMAGTYPDAQPAQSALPAQPATPSQLAQSASPAQPASPSHLAQSTSPAQLAQPTLTAQLASSAQPAQAAPPALPAQAAPPAQFTTATQPEPASVGGWTESSPGENFNQATAGVPSRAGVLPANGFSGENPMVRNAIPSEQRGSNSFTPTGVAALLPAGGTISSVLQRQAPITVEPTEASATTATTDTNVTEPLMAEVFGSTRPAGFPRLIRSSGEPASREYVTALAEKIAGGTRAIFPEASSGDLTGKKDFLSTGPAAVITQSLSVGTDVAHVPFVMPAAPFSRSKTFPTVETVANVSVTVDTPPALNSFSDVPAPPASLRETMAAVVTAVEALERRADSAQKSVDLQFQVGSERLALRVELRDGTVHTTFRTESPELRTALAHEWQAIVPQATGREWRLADPVFSSTSASGGESASNLLGQGAPHQRGQQTPEPAVFSPTPDYPGFPAAESTSATPAASNSTSLLQAFA